MVLRYYPGNDFSPATVKKALSKSKGVDTVEIDTDARTITVGWKRKCVDLPDLEKAAAKAGTPAFMISHVHMVLTFKALENADVKALDKNVRAVKGVTGISVDGTAVELHADLRELSIENLRSAVQTSGYEMTFKSHRWVEAKVTVSGNATIDGVRKQIERIPGTLVMKPNADTLGFWAGLIVTEQALRAVAKKAGATLEIKFP